MHSHQKACAAIAAGQPVPMPEAAEDVMVNNRLRGALETALAGIELFGAPPERQREAQAELASARSSARLAQVRGSEVERIERYHREPGAYKDDANPLFAERSLFRD